MAARFSPWGPPGDVLEIAAAPATTRAGNATFAFSPELARAIVLSSSDLGAVVLDPFARDGAVCLAAAEAGRVAVGFEMDIAKAGHVRSRLSSPHRIVDGEVRDLDGLDPADLVVAAPPYLTFADWDDNSMLVYWTDFDRVFRAIRGLMKPGARLVVHVANPVDPSGASDPLAFRVAVALADLFTFVREIVLLDPARDPAGRADAGHAYLLLLEHPERATRQVRDVDATAYL